MPEPAAEVSIERDANRWTLVLDRAEKANALSASLVERLIEGVAQAEAAGASVIAFRGNGRNFSAGFDFSDHEMQSEADLLLRFVRIETLLQRVAGSPCLTVALAHGRNFGAGVDLFGACRWRIATLDATFRMPGLGFGLVLGTRRFASIVGAGRAREILESLATFDAPAAHGMGFVTRVSERAQWPGVLDDAHRTAGLLTAEARAALYRVLGDRDDDADLADLVRSASASGIKQRIADYLAKAKK